MGWLRKQLEMLIHWSSPYCYEDVDDLGFGMDRDFTHLLTLEKKLAQPTPTTKPAFLAQCLQELGTAAKPATVAVTRVGRVGSRYEPTDPNTIYQYDTKNALGDISHVSGPLRHYPGKYTNAVAFLQRLAKRDFAGLGYRTWEGDNTQNYPRAAPNDSNFKENWSLQEILANWERTPTQFPFILILRRWDSSGNPRGELTWNDETQSAKFLFALRDANVTDHNKNALHNIAKHMIQHHGYAIAEKSHYWFWQQQYHRYEATSSKL